MHSDIFIAATGLIAQEKRLEVIANNLANANTPGFKRDVPSFGILLENQFTGGINAKLTAVGDVSSYIPVSNGVSMYRTNTDFSQGPLRHTGNPHDFALQGEGFFVLSTPAGVRYTRNGSFQIGADNYLVTQQGYRVMGDAGDIQIMGDELQCDTMGRLRSAGREIDRLRIVEFSDPSVLQKAGESLFVVANENIHPGPATGATVHQGSVELSNVDVVKAMMGMIDALRAFESHQKAIMTLDEASQKASNDLGRL
jgi:flagellar basal-body rod protein FlgF